MEAVINTTGALWNGVKINCNSDNRQPAKPWFSIQSLKQRENQCMPAGNTMPRNYFEIIWVKKGEAVLQVDTMQYAVGNDVLCCLVPGQICLPVQPGQAEGWSITFSPELLQRMSNLRELMYLFEQSVMNKRLLCVTAGEELAGELEGLIHHMIKECSSNLRFRWELLEGLLNILLIYFVRKLDNTVQQQSVSRETELARRFMAQLKQHFMTRKRVADYAALLHVTPNYLNRSVKHVTGFPVRHHIQQQVVLEAKRQIIYHHAGSMKEVAYQLGFDNLAHFSKFFKHNSGMSFSDFRKSALFG